MNRRAFFGATVAALGVVGQGTALLGENNPACPPPFPHVEGLTRYVAEFIINTRYENTPREVVELGKKDILDGFGLALSGSVGETGVCVNQPGQDGRVAQVNHLGSGGSFDPFAGADLHNAFAVDDNRLV